MQKTSENLTLFSEAHANFQAFRQARWELSFRKNLTDSPPINNRWRIVQQQRGALGMILQKEISEKTAAPQETVIFIGWHYPLPEAFRKTPTHFEEVFAEVPI